MSLLNSQYPVQLAHNAQVIKGRAIGDRQLAVLNAEGFEVAKGEISRWPGYAVTPLCELDRAADQLALGGIWYKDEAGRFGLGSFKALGGAYAVARLLKRELVARGVCAAVPSTEELLSGQYAEALKAIVVTCATDGNHGRSVAWGCQLFGCGCVIYIHATVSEGRRAAIAAYGAEVVRVPGNYDDAVRQAAADAAELGRFVVSDTSYPGYMEVPRDVMQGYTLMAQEAFEQLPEGVKPTHIFLQGGVGGLAAAVVAQAWLHYGAERPHCVVVEPDLAACLYESAKQGAPTVVEGDLDTLMAGLACGEVSLLAWEVLSEGASDFMTVTDQAAVDCMRLMANGALCSERPVVAGESAVAGLAGVILAAQQPSLREALGLDENSQVLLIGSEGATDPELYTELVGRSAEAVERGE
ncbi:diaminopropionate ammonia-lyase [Motiliproteus sp. SC1-56]|uniref:diaminopropionate ammonia-lyase n=1 Tax=Motiliproteus sp. SC1-56 TaxID=2799565 RepID=UPI001A8DC5C5|nr:diaminopropionate ammonia-lyase [Motiliproteus sp. SC1-56]